MDPEPFNWWWSGAYWYCSVMGPNGPKSGSGTTKEKAAKDARINAWKGCRRSSQSDRGADHG